MKSYWMADLRANGELKASTSYEYASLEQLPGCAELIGRLSGLIWQTPEEFETDLCSVPDRLELRWRATADTAGLMTLRAGSRVVSITVLAAGLSGDADALTIGALQRQLLHELHGTPYEPAFALVDLRHRPLAATVDIFSPDPPALQSAAAVADRCFAAAYFRYLGLV